jgi:hypothetical protein
MAVSDQSPASVGVRNVQGGAQAAGVLMGTDISVSDFIQWIQGYKGPVVFDVDGNGNVEYIGTGLPGAHISDAAWQIQRFYYDVNENVESIRIPEKDGAVDAGFVHIYANRAALTYPDPRA